MVEMGNAYKFFVGIPEGKRPLGRTGSRGNPGKVGTLREKLPLLVCYCHLTSQIL
jgi:hypothetical protein